MNDWQKRGYDAWLELWVANGCSPTAGNCPARWMKPDTQERADFISGWNTAKREHASNGAPAAASTKEQAP